jgi:hypothetical protein
MSDYIYHITLDTGDIASTPRSAVSDNALVTLGAHLKRAIAAKRDIIPTTACTLMASHAGPLLLCTILDIGGRPVLTFGVAPRARGADTLWTMLTQNRQFDAEPGDPPPAPWVAVRMDAGASSANLADWMGDYERCIAWAWIEGYAK